MSTTQSSASYDNTPGGARSRPDLNPRRIIGVSGPGIPINDCIGINESILVVGHDDAGVPIGSLKPITISNKSARLSRENSCSKRKNKEGFFHCYLRFNRQHTANRYLGQGPKPRREKIPLATQQLQRLKLLLTEKLEHSDHPHDTFLGAFLTFLRCPDFRPIRFEAQRGLFPNHKAEF